MSTPNLTSLLKRIRFLFGKSPNWPISEFYQDGEKFTGHWREYTISELETMCKMSGFTIKDTYNVNLLARFKKISSFKKNLHAFLALSSLAIPGSREMNYIICKKPE